MIKYLGSKRTLLNKILTIARALPDVRTVLDLFSGTSRVGHALKAAGYSVTANDHNAYAHTLATCYVQADRERVEDDARRLLSELAKLPPRPGYFTETFCEKSRFFHPRNGARIDAMREQVTDWSLSEDLEAVLLTSLMEAADRVDSTTGVQMAYLKSWAPRALNELELRLPAILPGPGRALGMDALEAVQQVEADLIYLDPPYNQHSYLGNYHIWESLVLWDKPDVYGIACKRIQCKDYKSDFNSKPRIKSAIEQLVRSARAKHLLVSFSDEGYIKRVEMEQILREKGSVHVVETDFKRYVGAQIGIYNPQGEKVGKVGHLRNKEYLYIVSDDSAAADAVQKRLGEAEMQLSLL